MTRLHLFALMLAVAAAPPLRADETVYFPTGAVRMAGWCSRSLELLGEHSLFQQRTNTAVEQYRFLWLRSFHEPIAVRIRKDSAGITLRVVRLGVGRVGVESHEASFALTAEQWTGFMKLMEKSPFWDLPSAGELQGKDGAMWVLERQARGKYQVIERHSPSGEKDERLKSFVACCRHLLKLSKLEIPERENY